MVACDAAWAAPLRGAELHRRATGQGELPDGARYSSVLNPPWSRRRAPRRLCGRSHSAFDKRTASDDAVAQLRSGMTSIAGWGRGKPMAFVRAILRSDVTDLTVVGPDLGLLYRRARPGGLLRFVRYLAATAVRARPHQRRATRPGRGFAGRATTAVLPIRAGRYWYHSSGQSADLATSPYPGAWRRVRDTDRHAGTGLDAALRPLSNLMTATVRGLLHRHRPLTRRFFFDVCRARLQERIVATEELARRRRPQARWSTDDGRRHRGSTRRRPLPPPHRGRRAVPALTPKRRRHRWLAAVQAHLPIRHREADSACAALEHHGSCTRAEVCRRSRRVVPRWAKS